jgi:hypothetical protein
VIIGREWNFGINNMRKYTVIGNKYSALLPHAISLGTLEDFFHMVGL